MIGAAGADPGRLVVHSHVCWVWGGFKAHAHGGGQVLWDIWSGRNTRRRETDKVTLQKAVAIRNGIALDERIRKWLARVISNLPP